MFYVANQPLNAKRETSRIKGKEEKENGLFRGEVVVVVGQQERGGKRKGYERHEPL